MTGIEYSIHSGRLSDKSIIEESLFTIISSFFDRFSLVTIKITYKTKMK